MQNVKWVIGLFSGKPANADDNAAVPYLKRLSDIAGQGERVRIQPVRTFGFKRQTFGLRRPK